MKQTLKIALGIIISAFFLWLAMKDVNFVEVLKSFKQINYYYLIFMIISAYLGMIIRTLRWQILLMPLKKTSFADLFSTIWISFMLLLILPARLGEFARAYLVGNKENISKTGAFSTIVMERILDGCSAIFLFIAAIMISTESSDITLMNFHFSSQLLKIIISPFAKIQPISTGGYLMNFTLKHLIYYVSFFYGAALLFVILLRIFGIKMVTLIKRLLFFAPVKIKSKICDTLNSFIAGFDSLSSFKSFILAVFYSLLLWFANGVLNYIILLAFGIECKFYIAFIILGFMVLGVMIPAAPGFIGTYHWVIMQAFHYYLPGYSREVAASWTWVSWSIGVMFIILVGFYYFKKENLNFKSIKSGGNDTEN